MSSENNNKYSFPIDVYIGKKLKQRRRLLGLKQYELAKMLGVTSQQIHKYEKGFDRISASRLLEIGKALSVPTCFFYEGLEEYHSQGKELTVNCINNQGKKFMIKLLDTEEIFTEMKVLKKNSTSEI